MRLSFVINWFLAYITNNYQYKRYIAASYATGSGIKKDERKARIWYEKASKAEDISSNYDLALMLLNGEGGPIDFLKGKSLLENAASKGEIMAQKVLAYAYQQGLLGFPIDNERSQYWKEIAESNGIII